MSSCVVENKNEFTKLIVEYEEGKSLFVKADVVVQEGFRPNELVANALAIADKIIRNDKNGL